MVGSGTVGLVRQMFEAAVSGRNDVERCSQEKQRFLTDVLHEVMLLDGLSSSHPISQEVEQATDIDRVFDWIAYKKVRELANIFIS